MPLSPIDLHQNFKATDARALVSIQDLTALNIHLGGDKRIYKNALSESLHNFSFQALSKETDDIYWSFDNVSELISDILEGLAKKNNESIAVTKNLGKNLQDKLDQTDFDLKNTVWVTNTRWFRKICQTRKNTSTSSTRFYFYPFKKQKRN